MLGALVVLLPLSASAGAPQQGVALTGTVKINGEIPKPRRIRMNDVEQHCGKIVKGEVDAENIVANPRGFVQWAFVYVKAGLEGKKFDVPKAPVVVQQQTCRYVPHVAGVMVGQDLLIRSGDPILHLPHVMPQNSREWAFSQMKVGEQRAKQFAAPEVMVRLICDVHPWMEAWIGVLEHPYYAVTDAAGKFEIKGLPPGTYTVEAWHEMYEPVTQQIEVGASAPKPIAFELTKRNQRR
jgi:hypothetical protein